MANQFCFAQKKVPPRQHLGKNQTIHVSLVESRRHRRPTCDEAWMCNPVCRVLSIMAQVPDLHVAIIDAENKGHGK